uniref:Uncharacterized protein n=1 Tax=Octopus bimaculoides TaxID=37653 RepID=A0A0L8I8I6_OCTBM
MDTCIQKVVLVISYLNNLSKWVMIVILFLYSCLNDNDSTQNISNIILLPKIKGNDIAIIELVCFVDLLLYDADSLSHHQRRSLANNFERSP